jgi:hypothetical protein
MEILSRFQYTLLHIKGDENICADALSRLLQHDPADPLTLPSDTWPDSIATCHLKHVCRSDTRSSIYPLSPAWSAAQADGFNYAAAGAFISCMRDGFLAPLLSAAHRASPQFVGAGGYTQSRARISLGDGCSGEEPTPGPDQLSVGRSTGVQPRRQIGRAVNASPSVANGGDKFSSCSCMSSKCTTRQRACTGQQPLFCS